MLVGVRFMSLRPVLGVKEVRLTFTWSNFCQSDVIREHRTV